MWVSNLTFASIIFIVTGIYEKTHFCFYLLLITQLLHAQNVIDLTGEWNFQIDKENKGIDEKWYARPLNDKINLPGSMPEN